MKWLHWSSLSNMSGCAKALCPFNSSTKVSSPAVDLILGPMICNVEYLVIQHKCFLFTSLQNVMTLPIIVIVRSGVNVVVFPSNGTCDLCIFAIFSKTGFVDIVPLCSKPSTYDFLSICRCKYCSVALSCTILERYLTSLNLWPWNLDYGALTHPPKFCIICSAVTNYDYRSYDFYRDISALSYRIFIAIFPVRVERYICAALALCKHDRFTTSLLKFQHTSITCRKWHDVCDCCPATVAEQHLRPWKMLQLPLK